MIVRDHSLLSDKKKYYVRNFEYSKYPVYIFFLVIISEHMNYNAANITDQGLI